MNPRRSKWTDAWFFFAGAAMGSASLVLIDLLAWLWIAIASLIAVVSLVVAAHTNNRQSPAEDKALDHPGFPYHVLDCGESRCDRCPEAFRVKDAAIEWGTRHESEVGEAVEFRTIGAAGQGGEAA